MSVRARVLCVVILLALAVSTTWAASPAFISKIKMHAAGDVTMDPSRPAVVAPGGLAFPEPLATLLGTGVLKIVATTDIDKGKATIGVWLVPGPAFPPEGQRPPELLPFETGAPVSVFVVKIQDAVLGDTDSGQPPTIAFLGKVIDNPVPSPFGPIVGRAAAISTQYDRTGNGVSFTFVGGFVAGSHSTWTFTASGSLYLPPE